MGIATPLSLPLCPQSFLSLFTQQLFTSSTFSFPNNAKSEVWLSLRFATKGVLFPLIFLFHAINIFLLFYPMHENNNLLYGISFGRSGLKISNLFFAKDSLIFSRAKAV